MHFCTSSIKNFTYDKGVASDLRYLDMILFLSVIYMFNIRIYFSKHNYMANVRTLQDTNKGHRLGSMREQELEEKLYNALKYSPFFSFIL